MFTVEFKSIQSQPGTVSEYNLLAITVSELLMNRVLLMLLIHVLVAVYAMVSFSADIKGQVLNTIRDDEGLKIILEVKEKKKKKTQVLYMPGENKAFVENEALLNKAKDDKKQVTFSTKKDVLSIIETVKLEK